jgi:hypothetical protein
VNYKAWRMIAIFVDEEKLLHKSVEKESDSESKETKEVI